MYSNNRFPHFIQLVLSLWLTTAVVACQFNPTLPTNDPTDTPLERPTTERIGLDRLIGEPDDPALPENVRERKPETPPAPLPTAVSTTPVATPPLAQQAQASDPTPFPLFTPTQLPPQTIPAEDTGWWNFVNSNTVRELAYDASANTLYAATGGGLVQWDITTGESRKLIIYNGLVSNDVLSVAVCPHGPVYAGTAQGIALYDPAEDSWDRWTTSNSPLREQTITNLICNETELLIGYSLQGIDRVSHESGTWTRYADTGTGLYSNAIRDLIQNNSGDTFISTTFGLNKIAADGSLTQWNEETGLPNDYISHIALTPTGTVWLATLAGAVRQTAAGDWELFNQDNVDNMPFGVIQALAPTGDDNGRLWLGTSLSTLCLLNPATRTCDIVINSPFEDTGIETMSLLLIDGVLYQGTEAGIFRWRAQNGQAESHFVLANQIPSNQFNSLAEDSLGYVWLGSDLGLIRAMPADILGAEWTHFTRDNSELPSNFVNALVTDRVNGGIWIGSYRGVTYFDGQTWRTLDSVDGVQEENVRVLALDGLGQLWLGTNEGLGRWDNTAVSWFTTADGLPHDRINALLYDETEATLWVGTEDGLVAMTMEGEVTAVYTREAGQLEREAINALALDLDGTLLLTNERYLLRHDPAQPGQFTRIGAETVDAPFLTSITVHPTLGDIWVGTTSNHLYFYEKESDSWRQLSQNVPSHQIRDILIDSLGTVWLAGNSYNSGGGGLGRFIPAASTRE